jgi:hypothetical protein
MQEILAEELNPRGWSEIDIEGLLNLAVDLRSRGYLSNFKFTKEEIKEAISIDGGGWETELRALCDIVYQ